MVRRMITMPALAALAFVLACMSASPALAFQCPRPLSAETGGEISTDAAKFEYRSWAWAEGAANRVCHCVRNLHRRPVSVNWESVGLKSYIPLNDTAYSMSSMPSAEHWREDTILRYGPRATPHEVNASTVFPGQPTRTSLLESYGPPVVTFAQYEAPPSDVPPEVSYGRVHVPPAELSSLSAEELDNQIAQRPDLLQTIEMEFTSTVDRTGDGLLSIDYRCSYSVQSAFGRPSVIFRIEDHEVHQAVFRSDQPVQLGGWGSGTSGRFEATGSLSVKASVDDLVVKTSTMQVIGQNGVVLGSMPIRIQSIR